MKNKKIGIISPSNNLLSIYPKRFEQGKNNLIEIGFEPIFSKNYAKNNDYSYKSINERINEVNDIINQDDIDLVIASIGGYLSIQLLDLIDYKKIMQKNITFCGCSDITALLLAIHVKTNKIVLYGPTYTVNFCDYGGIDEYTKKSFINCYNKENFVYKPPTYIIDEYIDWGELEKTPRIKHKSKKNNDWKIVNSGKCEGKLIGGNLSTILLILGTEYLPVEIFKDRILFLEDCETNINEFCSYLESLRLNGIFDYVKGIIFGKFDTDDMNCNIEKFLVEYFKNYSIPVVCNLDFGHIFPILTIPIGTFCEMNCNNNIELKINFKE